MRGTRFDLPAFNEAVVEADESDKSLMVFNPEHAIITNASEDHFGIDETRVLFESFRARVGTLGPLWTSLGIGFTPLAEIEWSTT